MDWDNGMKFCTLSLRHETEITYARRITVRKTVFLPLPSFSLYSSFFLPSLMWKAFAEYSTSDTLSVFKVKHAGKRPDNSNVALYGNTVLVNRGWDWSLFGIKNAKKCNLYLYQIKSIAKIWSVAYKWKFYVFYSKTSSQKFTMAQLRHW